MIMSDGNSKSVLVVFQGIGLMVLCGLLTWSLSGHIDQSLLTLIFIFLLGTLALTSPSAAIVITFVFLAALGDIRRLMLYYVGPVQYDTLLLVGPVVAGILFVLALFQGKLEAKNMLGRLIQILMIIMVIQIFNPIQGGLLVGIGGAIFYLVPLMWFWVGQRFGTQHLLHVILFRVMVTVAVVAALFGIYQIFVEYPPYQESWITSLAGQSFGSLVRNRPFAFFTSPPEFAWYCSAASTVVLSGLVIKKFKPQMLFAPVLIFGAFLQSGRGATIANIVALVGIWGMRRRAGETSISLPRVITVGVIFVGAYIGTLVFLSSASDFDDRIAPIIAHQTEMLDPMHTTAVDHSQLIYVGIVGSFTTDPAGLGLGSTTLASGKMGGAGAVAGGTETDVSNIFSALGPAGGIIYVMVLFQVVKMILRNIRNTETTEGLALLGFFICVAGQWLSGQCYSIAGMLWFCIGTVHRIELDREREMLPLSHGVPLLPPVRRQTRSQALRRPMRAAPGAM
ncbi:hypothetical protein BH10PLA1_BH10PLA1_03470 [soil metagenome]